MVAQIRPAKAFTKKYPHLLWMDLETTGADARTDDILEVGFVLTRSEHPYVEILDGNYFCRPSFDWKDKMNDFVTQMHTDNSLIEAIDKRARRDLPTPADLASDIVQWIQPYAKRRRVLIAGSGVAHFDRRFIARYMPDLNDYLAYPAFDVGVIRRWLASLDALPSREFSKTHRAREDAIQSLEEARMYASYIHNSKEQVGTWH